MWLSRQQPRRPSLRQIGPFIPHGQIGAASPAKLARLVENDAKSIDCGTPRPPSKFGQHHLLFVRRTCILVRRGKVIAADALLGRFLPRLGPLVETRAASFFGSLFLWEPLSLGASFFGMHALECTLPERVPVVDLASDAPQRDIHLFFCAKVPCHLTYNINEDMLIAQ
jgi:hypothetical protein